MTPTQILKEVQNKADARFGETIERLLIALRYQHSHQSWRKECRCEYCRFITDVYVEHKLFLHKLKKRLRHYDYLWALSLDEASRMMSVEDRMIRQQQRVHFLKQHKKELHKNVL